MSELLAVTITTGVFTLLAALGGALVAALTAQRGEDRRAAATAERERRAEIRGPIVEFGTSARGYIGNLEIVVILMAKARDPLGEFIEYDKTDSGKKLQADRARLDLALAELRHLLRDDRGRQLFAAWGALEKQLGEQQAAIQRRPRPDPVEGVGAYLARTRELRELVGMIEDHAAS